MENVPPILPAEHEPAATSESPLQQNWWLPLTIGLPMALLVFCFLESWLHVRTEMTGHQQRIFWTIIAIALSNFVTAGLLWRRRQRHDNVAILPYIVGLLLYQIVAIVLSVVLVPEMHPNVAPFILSPDRWIVYLLTFYMPGLFYCMILLVTLLSPRIVYPSALLVFLIPVFMYVIFNVSQHTRWWSLPTWICNLLIVTVLLVLGIGFYLSILKIMLSGLNYCCRRQHGPIAVVILAAWVLPFAGLLLNILIPFPVDFQDWRIYAATLINGTVLLLPIYRNRVADLIITFAKGACYPFALYFFLVFLPFLPLSVPAIIAYGAGFLILAPTFLFIVQNYRLRENYCQLCRYLPKHQFVAAFLGGVCVLPLWFAGEIIIDKIQLDYAIKAYFHSPYLDDAGKQRNLSVLRITRTLERLYSCKEGIEMPFLTPVYKQLVFSDLVLSDDKIKRMYFDLAGKPIVADSRGFSLLSSFSDLRRSGRSRRQLTGLADRRTSSGVALYSFSATPIASGARLHLSISSSNSWNGEYVTELTLPPVAMVSGLTLKIDGKIVPGRIFERKSAFWIYEKITNVQRDPALLSYISPTRLKLHVFPVTSKEKRDVTIDLFYPPNTAIKIEFGGNQLSLPMLTSPRSCRIFTPEMLQSRASLKRRPELVFIVDRSMKFSEPELLKMMQHIASRTDAASCRISSGIIAAAPLSQSFPVAELDKAGKWFFATHKPGTPGFAAQRIVKGSILRYHNLNAEGNYPLFVLISDQAPDKTWQLAHFSTLMPDLSAILTVTAKGEWSYCDLPSGKRTSLQTNTAKIDLPVKSVCRLDNGKVVTKDMSVACYNPEPSSADSYDRALYLQQQSRELLFDPSCEEELLPQLVQQSKATGILIPQTAYIVLENEAQWKALQDAEKNKLKKSSAFDIEETEVRSDAPPVWLLLLVVVPLLGLFSRRSHAGKRDWSE